MILVLKLERLLMQELGVWLERVVFKKTFFRMINKNKKGYIMAQLNRNVNYLYTIDGNTIWERLRNIRNFLADRKLAKEMADLSIEKLKRLKSELPNITDLDREFEIREALIQETQLVDNLNDCIREIKFLEELETKYLQEAEKSRIIGKTDEEMYEINYFDELAMIHLLDIQTQLITTGAITSEMLKTLLRNPYSMQKAIEFKLIDPNLNNDLLGLNIVGNISKNEQQLLLGGKQNE